MKVQQLLRFWSICFSSSLGQRQWLLSISQEGILWKKSGLWFYFLPSDRTVQPRPQRSSFWKLCWNRYHCEMFPRNQHILIKRNILLRIVPGSSPLECLKCFNSSQFSMAASCLWYAGSAPAAEFSFLQSNTKSNLLLHLQGKNLLFPYSIKLYKWNSGDNSSSSIAIRLLIIYARLKTCN